MSAIQPGGCEERLSIRCERLSREPELAGRWARVLASTPGVHRAELSPFEGHVCVHFDPGKTTARQVRSALGLVVEPTGLDAIGQWLGASSKVLPHVLRVALR